MYNLCQIGFIISLFISILEIFIIMFKKDVKNHNILLYLIGIILCILFSALFLEFRPSEIEYEKLMNNVKRNEKKLEQSKKELEEFYINNPQFKEN